MNKKGLTLIELLIVIFLLAIILSAVYITYTTLLKDYRKETKNIETEIEKMVGLDILRLDITHAGYGISDNETSKVIECINCEDPDNIFFIIRSTFNVTNNDTQHWIFVDADDNKTIGTPDNNIKYVYIDINKKLLKDSALWTNKPNSGKYIAYPVQDNAIGCSNQTCTKITYKLSTTNLPETCNPNTFKLLRAVNNGNGDPILDCVADFKLRFDYDKNNDGEINSNEELLSFDNISSDNSTAFRNKLKRVRIFILLQDGGYDRDFTFQGADSNNKITVDGVKLQLPNNYTHYRWKTVVYTIKPMDL